MAYSPWGHKESNTAEQLTLLLFHFLGQLKAAEKFYQTDVNIGLCKINSGPGPKDLNQWFAGLPALLWARPWPSV